MTWLAEYFSDFGKDGIQFALSGAAVIISIIALLVSWSSNYKSTSYDILLRMLDNHRDIYKNIQDSTNKTSNYFSEILSEFAFIYKNTKNIFNTEDYSIADRINIAYTFLFFGPSQHLYARLEQYDDKKIKELNDLLCMLRDKNQRYFQFFRGNQQNLGHYTRSLFAMYRFVDNRIHISQNERYEMSKIIRINLSNYEQALLALNMISHLGEPWRGKLTERYHPIKNIPEDFFLLKKASSLWIIFQKLDLSFKILQIKKLLTSEHTFLEQM